MFIIIDIYKIISHILFNIDRQLMDFIMRYFPIFVDLENQQVAVSGAGECAVAKLRLLLKTPAKIRVFGTNPDPQILLWHINGCVDLVDRALQPTDMLNAKLFYAANADKNEDARVLSIARNQGVLANAVDDLEASQFITPAIVDREPVTVAIGTEGTAPVLARRIKSKVEELLPTSTGTLAKFSAKYRNYVANIGNGKKRRQFWERFFTAADPFSSVQTSIQTLRDTIGNQILDSDSLQNSTGKVIFVGSGPGDPGLLTLNARHEIESCDVVLYDNLVSHEILDLARREAKIVNVGKRGYIGGWRQKDINDLMIEHVIRGDRVVRLKSGDPVLFGRLDEELQALDDQNIEYDIIPGITAASAAAATIGRSLTRRKRNSAIRFVTGHSAHGYSEFEWKDLAHPNAVTVVYMGQKAVKYMRGRLMMHGAAPDTPVTVVANVTRSNEKILVTSLQNLPDSLAQSNFSGPVIMLLGLSPREAELEQVWSLIEERA